MYAVRMLLKILVISTFILPALAYARVGTIEKIGVGTSVRVTRGGNPARLKEGSDLESGDEVVTDANTAVDIRLEDETLIRVGVNSSYLVKEDSKIHTLIHHLLSGVVRVLVKPTEGDKKSGAIKFRMDTPEGTIGVRGTEFVVLRSNGKTQLKGLDGTVLFGPLDDTFANDDTFVTVNRGFESEIKDGGKKPGGIQKLDLKSYLNSINGSGGPFGPLSARLAGHGGYVRNNPPPVHTSPPIASNTGPAPQPPQPPPQEQAAPKETPKKVDYQTMLLKAALEGDLKDAETALKKGANINAPAPKGKSMGKTALMVAMLQNHEEMFMFLIKKCADVDQADTEGNTPLVLAATDHVNIKYVKALVDPGAADSDIPDKNGKKPADVAKEHGNAEMAAYLESDAAILDFNNAYKAKSERLDSGRCN